MAVLPLFAQEEIQLTSEQITIRGTRTDINGALYNNGTPVIANGVTLSAIGSSPNANALSLTGQVLNAQPASAAFGGLIANGVQSLPPGKKTFTDDVEVTGVLTNNGSPVAATTVGTFGNTPNANGATITSGALHLQPFDFTFPGCIKLGPQVFPMGKKTFEDKVRIEYLGGLEINNPYGDPDGDQTQGTVNWLNGQLLFAVNNTFYFGLNKSWLNEHAPSNCVIMGTNAGAAFPASTDVSSVAIGSGALQFCTGLRNDAVGKDAGSANTSGSDNLYYHNVGVNGESGSIWIGTAGTHTTCHTAGIVGVTATLGVPVVIAADGKMGTIVSSLKYKTLLPLKEEESSMVLKLEMRKFCMKDDVSKTPQYGFIAEEVLKVIPSLVRFEPLKDADGEVVQKDGNAVFTDNPQTLDYNSLFSLLQNELKLVQKRVNTLERIIHEAGL